MAVYTAVDKSTDHFSPTLYVGNGGTLTVTGVPFEPDMTWLKNRSVGGDNEIYDKLRGATYRIYPNTTGAQDSLAQGLQAWTSDGFRVGNNNAINGNGNNHVSWNWKANGQGSSNTDGSINTTYTSANTTSGCAIITYTGTGANATIGHGLGVTPNVMLAKRSNASGQWDMYHSGLSNPKSGSIVLNDTAAFTGDTSIWNNLDPTSSLVNIGTSSTTNTSGGTYVMYCFAEKTGFSKFGSYTGTGNVDGTFCYTGFKPAWVMIKCSSAAYDEWFIWDSKRLGYNGANNNIYADTNDAESTAAASGFDILSNGFKLRTTDTALNGSGRTYIYMAFAEAPLVGSNNVPATAR